MHRRWASAKAEYSVSYQSEYEPYILCRRDIPPFDLRFSGYGGSLLPRISPPPPARPPAPSPLPSRLPSPPPPSLLLSFPPLTRSVPRTGDKTSHIYELSRGGHILVVLRDAFALHEHHASGAWALAQNWTRSWMDWTSFVDDTNEMYNPKPRRVPPGC